LRDNMDVWVFVWLYCLFWWIIQDVVKVATYQIIHRRR
jgi:hypothetical protein